MLVSNSVGLYLVIFAVAMGIAALSALFVGGVREQSSSKLRANNATDAQSAQSAEAAVLPAEASDQPVPTNNSERTMSARAQTTASATTWVGESR